MRSVVTDKLVGNRLIRKTKIKRKRRNDVPLKVKKTKIAYPRLRYENLIMKISTLAMS